MGWPDINQSLPLSKHVENLPCSQYRLKINKTVTDTVTTNLKHHPKGHFQN